MRCVWLRHSAAAPPASGQLSEPASPLPLDPEEVKRRTSWSTKEKSAFKTSENRARHDFLYSRPPTIIAELVCVGPGDPRKFASEVQNRGRSSGSLRHSHEHKIYKEGGTYLSIRPLQSPNELTTAAAEAAASWHSGATCRTLASTKRFQIRSP
jgi:hypothetical protein